jgi:tape measure domain-containing protein
MADKKLQVTIDLKDQFTQKMNEISKSTSETNNRMGGLTTTILKANIAFAALSKIGSFVVDSFKRVGGAVRGFLTESLNMAGALEQNRMALDVMIGSAEKAAELLTNLSKFAAVTPFNLTDLQGYTKQLIAFGYGADDIIPIMTKLGNVSAGVGMDKLPNIVYAMGQVKVAGRLMGQELLQFINAGVPLIEALADTMGIAQESVRTYVEQGKVGYAQVERAMASLSDEGGRFEGLMNKQSTTLFGLQSNFEDFTDSIKRRVGGIDEAGNIIKGGLIDKVRGGFVSLMEYIDGSTNTIQRVADFLSGLVGKVAEVLQSFVEAALTSDKVRDSFNGLKEAARSLIGRISEGKKGFMEFGKEGETVGETIATTLIDGVTNLIQKLEALWGWFQDNKEEIMEFATAMGDAAKAVGELAKGIAKVGKYFKDNENAWKTLKVLTMGPAMLIPDLKKKFEKNAAGTMYSSGGMTLVGERGPELVHLPRGSKVYNNNQTKSVGGGTTNININLSGAVVTNQEQFIRELESRITKSISNQNRLYQYGIS